MTDPAAGPDEARRRAALLVDARQYDRARTELGRALAAAPDDVDALALLAVLEQRVGDHDASLAALDRAAALGLDPVAGLGVRMNTLYLARRFAPAVAAAQELLALDPHHVTAHILLAQMLGGEGRLDYHRARAHAEQAVSLAPDDDHAHYALGTLLASTHGRRGARAGLPHLQRAVSLAPEKAVNLNALGLAELRRRRWRRAARAFASALALDPSLEPAAFNLPLAMVHVVARVALGMVAVLLGAVVAASGLAAAGAPWWVHGLAVVVVLGLGAVAAWRLDGIAPVSARRAARIALRRDPVLRPQVLAATTHLALSVLALAVPALAGLALLVGIVVRVVDVVAVRRVSDRYVRERADLWRPGPVR